MAVWALLSISQTVKAADDVYLLSAEQINGVKGGYNDTNTEHQMELESGDTYKIKIASNSADVFWFRVRVGGESSYQLYPSKDGATLNISEAGSTNTAPANNSGSGAWKVSFDKNTYEYITIHVVIRGQTKVWVDGKKKGSGTGTSPTPSDKNPIANRKYSKGYYLVGNCFNFD